MFLDPVGTARLFQAGSAALMNGVAANCALASHVTRSVAGAVGAEPPAVTPRKPARAAPPQADASRARSQSWYRPPPRRGRSWYRPPPKSAHFDVFAPLGGNAGAPRFAPGGAFGGMPWFNPLAFVGKPEQSPFVGWPGATAWPGLDVGVTPMQEAAETWLRLWIPFRTTGKPKGGTWPWQAPLATTQQTARTASRPAGAWTDATAVSETLERTGAAIRRVAAGPAPIPHVTYQAPVDQGLAGSAGVPDAMRPWGLLVLAVAVPPAVHDLAMTLAGSAWFRPVLGS